MAVIADQLLRPAATQLAAALESDWDMTRRDVGRQVAYAITMERELGRDVVVQVFGLALAERARILVQDFFHLYRAGRMMDNGQAALIAWRETSPTPRKGSTGFDPERRVLGVIRSDQLPPGTTLAGWPVVVALLSVAFTGAGLLIADWQSDVDMLREENRKLELEAVARLQSSADSIKASNPDLWAKLQLASAKALQASADAAKDPVSWFDKLAAQVGAIVGTTIPPLVWMFAAWWLWQQSEDRAT